ncbi:MAG: hypothetical protein QM770_01195 [Tepidisphaeraceae bacterium]
MPIEAAVREGVLNQERGGEAPTPREIASIHNEHAREIVGNLSAISRVYDCRRKNLNPATGKPLGPKAKPVDYRKLIRGHWRQHRQLLDVYEEAFGRAARRAFDRHCVAAVSGTLIIELGGSELPLPTEIGSVSDDAERGERSIKWFDDQCPSVWPPDACVWNADVVGPFRIGRRQVGYPPDHPHYYHRGGCPVEPERIIHAAPEASIDQLDGLASEPKGKGDDVERLARHEEAMKQAVARYRALRDEGPRRLSAHDKTSGRFGKTPVTLWAEAMPSLYNAVFREASIVKALLRRVRLAEAAKARGGIGEQLNLF